jgi:uncharacterized protein (TIGR04255 family)
MSMLNPCLQRVALLDLPEYVSRPLARSPLVLVALQINFEEVGREVAHAQARQVQKAVGPLWSNLQANPLVTATMTPDGAINQPNRQAYRLLSADSKWSALLTPDSVVLETQAYPGWEEMSQTVAAFANAIAEVFDPASELRLGLRYIDQVPLPDGKVGWDGLIPDHLLGVALDPRLSDGVLASDQRVLLQVDEQIRCVLRHGLLANSEGEFGKVYLLDYDMYRENAGPYSPGAIVEGAEALHSFIGRLFRASITDDLNEWLGG